MPANGGRVVQGPQVGVDRGDGGLAGGQGGPVVPERRRQGRVVEALLGDPGVMLERPVVAAAPHPGVAQQELAETVPGPGLVDHHVGAGPAQIAHRFLGRCRHPHRSQLPGRATATPGGGHHDGRSSPCSPAPSGSTMGRSPHNASRRPSACGAARSRSGRPHNTPTPSPDPRTGRSNGAPLVVGADLVDQRQRRAGLEHRRRNGVLVHVHCQDGPFRRNMDQHGRLLPYVARPTPWWATHARCGTGRPFHTH